MADLIEITRDPPPVVEVIYPAGPQGPEGPQGPPGADSTVPGPQGPQGATGPAGPGVATGGTTGQLLTKTSAVDFATAWQNPAPADLSTVPLLAPADNLRNTLSGATGRLLLSGKTTGDAQPRLTIDTNGTHAWGDGTNPSDTTLSRQGANTLQTGAGFIVGASVSSSLYLFNNSVVSARYASGGGSPTIVSRLATGDANDRFRLNADGSQAWGDGTATADTTLARAAAGILAIGTTAQKGTLRMFGAITSDLLIDHRVTTDSSARFYIRADGFHAWGPGNAAQDITMSRSSAGYMTFTLASGFEVTGGAGIISRNADFATGIQLTSNTPSSVRSPNFVFIDNQATPKRIFLRKDADQLLVINDTGGTTRVSFELSAGNRPTTLAGILIAGLGVTTKTKAGTPVDADWVTAPPDGTIVIDTTASKIWARIGGVWKQTVALT